MIKIISYTDVHKTFIDAPIGLSSSIKGKLTSQLPMLQQNANPGCAP